MAGKRRNAAPRAPQAPRAAGGTVAVALNYPTDLLFEMPGGREVCISGNASHLRGQEMGVLPVGAYGITVVNADDWEYIKRRYGGSAIFRNGLIFARGKKADASAKARERAELRHGYEPVNPEKTATEPAKKEG